MKRLNPSGCSRILSAVFFALAMTGCHAAMPTPSDTTGPHTASHMFPLRFKTHGFEAYCYNTRECTVVYYDHNFTRPDASALSAPPSSPDYRDHWNPATRSGIGNFPPPAEVRWTSLDGVAHKTAVDIGAIFKDERVLYRVPDSEIPENSWGGDPSIFLEVNDRTINVYMQAFIATKTEQIPGNKDSDFRDDVILAWSHTY